MSLPVLCFTHFSAPRRGLRSLASALVLAAFTLGCSSTTSGGESPQADNGQTGSIGQAECETDADCAREANAIVAQLMDEGHDAQVRSASCAPPLCEIVLRRGDECFVDSPYGVAYDCTKSDPQILSEEAERQRLLATCGGQGCPEAPAPSYYPRDAGEWQGMLVSLEGPYCEESGQCGLALACREQECGACTTDQDCAAGEGCALDHCLKTELISCRGYRDCAAGQLCLLSGITGGTPRGNEDMRSYCL